MGKIIHIVFSQSGEGSFKYAINRKKTIVGDKIIALYDNLSNGKIDSIIDSDHRETWWKEVIDGEPRYGGNYIDSIKENYPKFYNEISQISDSDTVYFWYGQCDREICGMIYTIFLLKDILLNGYSVNVSDIFIKKKDGVVLVNSAAEIVPEQLGDYMVYAKKIEIAENKDLVKQWDKLVAENSLLRTYKKGKICSVSEDYFDKDILKFTDKEYKFSGNAVRGVILNSESRIADDYIFWRIKKLVKAAKINFRGNFGVMTEMEICITDEGLKYLGCDSEAMEFWNKRIQDREKHRELIKEIKYQNIIEERIRIAKNLLDVLDVETIAKKTGLNVELIKNFK